MYLKRIEMAGFKSFANRTVVDFENQVTAVVGPNGSGKSNITEAIRWVLGESSAKNLRGGKMPDIIFAGSETRKPLNIAEVTVVLDNSDSYLPLEYNEISVTRRLRRSGESDFFLNKQSCRLRDIQELFMDSGLGKESFSIISQGKVEAIFSSKPEDRRGIFEEAAGVLKYKTRKKQAESKLSETQDNLSRVQDIIYELEEQLSPLKEQKEVAEKFLQMKESLTKLDVAYIIAEMTLSKKKLSSLLSQLKTVDEQLGTMQESISQKEHSLQELRQQRERLDEAIEEGNVALVSLVEALKQAEGKREVLEERSKHTLKSSQEYQENLDEIEEKITDLEEEKSEHIVSLSVQNRELQALEKKIDLAKQELVKYEKSTKELIEELRGQYVEWMQTQASISNERKYLERQYQQELAKNEQNNTRQEQLVIEITEKEEKVAEVRALLEEEQAELQGKRANFTRLQTTSKETQQRLDIAQKQMYQLMNESQQAKARQKSLQDIQENYTGYYQGVRIALQHRENLHGIVGAVAELIDVPENYTLAIETALGGAMQHIVVESEQDARQAITFLKQRQAGRATFLPITTIKERVLPEYIVDQASQQEGFVGVASDLLSYSETITSIVRNLLGMVLIAEDLQSANALARAFQFRYRVVSLEGDVMNAGGSMTGGATKRNNQASLFSQGAELQQLTGRVKQLEKQLTETEKRVQELQQLLTVTNAELDEIRQAGTDNRTQEQDFSSQHQVLLAELDRLKKDQHIFSLEQREWKSFLAEYEEKEHSLAEEQEEITSKLTQIQEEITTLNQEEDGIELRRQTLREELGKMQSLHAVSKEKVTHLQQTIYQLNTSIEENQRRQETLERQLSVLSLDVNDREESQETLQVQIEEMIVKKEDVQTRLQERREDRYRIHDAVRREDDELAQFYREQKEKLKEQSQLVIEKDRTDVLLDNRMHYLEEEYELTFERASMMYEAIEATDEAKREIQVLKRGIEALGPVNSQSIEQYDQVNERHVFLTVQRDDLLMAKGQLSDTMAEMDEEVKQRFSEVFEAIRGQFKQVFPSMFGGGRAELLLTQPDDLLNTGIEIEAQPPGKKLQSLSLLSGGERALTAIALLFSIIKVRPVPFCVLDEVEAALDEANVLRFGRYLQSSNHNTQFIVVTHRKGTMEAADVLYGVTMEESGVSKVVSVRLDDVKEDEKIAQ